MKLKIKFFLPVMCMAISSFTLSCSSEITDLSEEKDVPAEKMLTISVTAATEGAMPATKAMLTEANGANSSWTWENGDKLLLITTNGAGKKQVTTLTLEPSAAGSTRGEFSGSIPVSEITDGNSYRFFYIGKNTTGNADRSISESEAQAGEINIDLASQTGKITDLKNNCVLSGTGIIAVNGTQATVEGGILLKNVFAIAHFYMEANDETAITKVGLRGTGVYTSASINLTTGKARGVTTAGLDVDPESNIFFPAGPAGLYITFVPGTVTPIFDAYYAGSYSDVITATPETRSYTEAESFVYYKNHKAAFSVSNTQRVAITNGNMQYVMPVKTYSYGMSANLLKANALIRWKKGIPLKIKGMPTIHAGYYRLASEQWSTAMPKNTKAGGSYSYETIKKDGKDYISPEKYRYFDLPSWGTIDNPTIIKNLFSISGTGTETAHDFGKKLIAGTAETRVMTSNEWAYLMPLNTNTVNNRVWVIGTKKYVKWARCFIDENGNNTRDTNPAELRGYLIFPDDMTYDEAKAVFTKGNPTFGSGNANSNPTTYEKIRNSGAVFIPLSAWRPTGSKTLSVWGEHGNYSTSSYQNGAMLHVRVTATSSSFADRSDPNQGCMSRLVQNLDN